MVRVVYEWRVEKAQQAAFVAAWEETTTTIRTSVAGARGSVLLRSQDQPDTFVSIARWDSEAQWRSFWNGATQTEMSQMHALAERISVTVYEELGDVTI